METNDPVMFVPGTNVRWMLDICISKCADRFRTIIIFRKGHFRLFHRHQSRIEIDFGSITGGLLFVGVTSMHFCRNQPTFVLMQNHIYYIFFVVHFRDSSCNTGTYRILVLFPSKYISSRAFRGSNSPTLYTGRTWIQSRHPSPAAYGFGTQPGTGTFTYRSTSYGTPSLHIDDRECLRTTKRRL